MDGRYYCTPLEGYHPHQPHVMPTEAVVPHNSMMMPDGFPQPRIHQIQTMSSETLNSYSDLEDPAHAVPPQQSGARGKRRPAQGSDHVKHRRTRSGCYTCRQRRVKCDENHPTCDRCRKGKRECVYPELSTSSKTGRSSSISKESSHEGSNSSSEDFDPENDRLPSIPDEDDEIDEPLSSTTAPTPMSAVSKDETCKFSNASSMSRDQSPLVKSPIQGTQKSTAPIRPLSSLPETPTQPLKKPMKSRSTTSSKWAHLPKDVRFYLNYHKQHLRHQHYSMKYDSGDFLKTTFLDIALGYEPLLYAITAFSAYHHTLTLTNGKIQNFLGYYNKSLTLLRHSLEKDPRHTLATLLTILQLATFEEFLGDWVNLMGHQKAAYQIITELFTPQTIMQSETHRKIITWYVRFDIFAGFLSGYETVLDREWHAACTEFYERQSQDRPKDLPSLFEARFAKSRLLAFDISAFFARKSKGLMSDEDSMKNLQNLGSRLAQMEVDLNSSFPETRTYIKDFPNAPAYDPEVHVMGPPEPDLLLAGELFTWNFIVMDFLSISLLFKSQIAQLGQNVSGTEVVQAATRICKTFEALQYCGQDYTAMTLGSQASLGMAAACLPKDEKHTMWCRRKYASIEACGYIYPAALRQRMTNVWGVDVTHWWLPNNEGNPPILQSLREFIEYRARVPQDSAVTDLRDMKGLFSALSLDDSDHSRRESRSTPADSEKFDYSPSNASQSLYESSPDTWM